MLSRKGAPADLVQTMAQPSIGKTEELMRQCDRILATGGLGMVTAAYSSGTPALGVGAGNAVITVDDTADLVDTAEKIRISKTLDLAASRSVDNSVIVLESVYDELLSNLIAEGGYVASPEEADKVVASLARRRFEYSGCCKAPQVLAEMSGFSIPEDRKFIIVYEVGREYLLGRKALGCHGLLQGCGHQQAVALTNAIQSTKAWDTAAFTRTAMTTSSR